MDLYNFDKIKNIMTMPAHLEHRHEWLLLEGLICFLESELKDDYILLFASSRYAFLQTALLPDVIYSQEEINDIRGWSGGVDSSWKFSCSDTECNIENPNSLFGSKVIATGEPVVHLRNLDGVQDYEKYFEINQRIYQVLELHYIHDKRSWCKLDEYGDLKEVIKTIEIELSPSEKLTVIVVEKEELSKYATATNQVLLRMMDFMAYNYETFSMWPKEREIKKINTGITFGEKTVALPTGSFFRGVQIVNISMPMKELVNNIWGNNKSEYLNYIIQDFKYNKIHSASCDPSKLDSYFEDTGKPLATSPAFFSAEVLRKYKSDSEKYTMKSRSIECRGSWRLRSHDINNAGQVFAYLCDLNKLPYREQTHWKQYNEEPKAPISKRAYENDFVGKFSDEEDVLEKLKRLITEKYVDNLEWWKLKSKDGLTKLHYPYTDSKDEWADEILNFDQLIVEGFDKKSLKNKARKYEATIENRFGSLKILESILVAKGYEVEDAYKLMSVFHEIHDLRNKVKGHVSGGEAEQLRKSVIKKYGSYKNHFQNLFERMVEALEILLDEIE